MNDIEAQQKLLYLVINNQDFVAQLLAEDINPDFFDTKYKALMYGIEQSHQSNSKFTEEFYLDFVNKAVANNNYKKWTGSEVTSTKIAATIEKSIYNVTANLDKVDVADFQLICRKVKEAYINKNQSSI
jgi:NhaP-type Na+/H+ and K+/H+ antiporter